MTQRICNTILLNIAGAILLCCLILLWSWSGSFCCYRCLWQYFDLLVLVTIYLCLIHIWMVCCYMGIFLPLQIKNRCCNVPLTLGPSIRESKRCAFYSSHGPDGNHSRPPRCQCAKANDEAATVAVVTGASILSFREILWCVLFARWLWISNLWRMPVFFVGYVLKGYTNWF